MKEPNWKKDIGTPKFEMYVNDLYQKTDCLEQKRNT